MVKRTRAASVASTVHTDSLASTSTSQDNEYMDETDHARPSTRRRTNNGRPKASSSTSAASEPFDAGLASPSPSSTHADDPKSLRKLQRKERNRISAQHSRDRKKNESQELRGRLEEAETRVSALQADNERLREENGRFKLELEKNSSLQGELTSLKERFEMLERLLLAGAQHSLPSSTITTPSAATTSSSLPSLSQTPISAPVQANSRIGSEAHATGMHSLFRSTTSLNSRSGMSESDRVMGSRSDASSSFRDSNSSSTQGSTMSNRQLSTIAPLTTSYAPRTADFQSPQHRHLSMKTTKRKAPFQPVATTKAYTRLSKSFSPAQAVSCLPTTRLSIRDKQRFLLRREQQQHQQRQTLQPSRQAQLRADLLARAKIITMTMIDSLSNNKRN